MSLPIKPVPAGYRRVFLTLMASPAQNGHRYLFAAAYDRVICREDLAGNVRCCRDHAATWPCPVCSANGVRPGDWALRPIGDPAVFWMISEATHREATWENTPLHWSPSSPLGPGTSLGRSASVPVADGKTDDSPPPEPRDTPSPDPRDMARRDSPEPIVPNSAVTPEAGSPESD